MSKFDKDIKNKLYHHSEEYDLVAFESIKKGINPPPKRKFKGVVFFLGSSLLVFILLHTILYWDITTENLKHKINVTNPQVEGVSYAAVEQNFKPEVAVIPTELKENQIQIRNAQDAPISTKKESQQEHLILGKASIINSSMPARSDNNNFWEYTTDDINILEKSVVETEMDSDVKASILHSSKIEVIEYQSEASSNNDISQSNINQATNNQATNSSPLFERTNQTSISDDQAVEAEVELVESSPIVDDNKASSKNLFEFATGVNLNHTKLSSLGEEQSLYQLARQNSESKMTSYSVAAYAGVRLRNNMVIKTGIAFTNLRDKFTYNDPTKEITKLVRSVKYLYGSGNRLRDSIVTTETISTPGGQLININNYNYIDIPIIAEINLFQRSKFTLSWNPGIFVNAMFLPNGYIFDEDAKSLISLADDDLYKNRIGFSFHNSLSFKYKLNKTLELNLEPSFRFSHLNSTTDQAAINEVLRTSQLNLSVRYHY